MSSQTQLNSQNDFLASARKNNLCKEIRINCDEDTYLLERATLADINKIMNLEESGFAEGIRENTTTFQERISCFPDGFWILKLKDTERVIGYICTEIWDISKHNTLRDIFKLNHSPKDVHTHAGDTLYISSQTIDPDFRGKRLGDAMFKTAIEHITSLYPNIKKHMLIVNEDWHTAQRIYLKSGFTVQGKIDSFFHEHGAMPRGANIMIKHI